MPEIEYVTLANHAEAINGLLYLQGAGWTDVQPPLGPQGQQLGIHLGIGISILVGWNETNTAYPFDFAIVHEDGGDPLVGGQAQIEAGRPPGIPPGGDIRTVIAVTAEVQFPRPGGYQLRATLAGQEKTVSFRVHPPPASPQQNFGPASTTL